MTIKNQVVVEGASMRVIKFRVWDNYKKEMIYCPDLTFGADGRTLLIWFKRNRYDVSLVSGENGDLMQFTGLLDKNGKEIYEGDIFNYCAYNNGIVYVEYHEDMFHLKSIKYPSLSPGNFRLASLNEQLEVIGNIYENPKLLAGVK